MRILGIDPGVARSNHSVEFTTSELLFSGRKALFFHLTVDQL